MSDKESKKNEETAEKTNAEAADKISENTLNDERLEEREKSELNNKHDALKVGDYYHYTLSNYDPVSVTVHVPSVGDLDVEFMMENFAHMHNSTLAKIDDAWLQKNLKGISTVDDFKKVMRVEAERLNAQYAEEQKTAAVVSELARRLEQRVPLEEIAKYREQILHAMQFDAQRQGTTLEQFLAQMGLSEANLDAVLDDRAAQAAGQDAALSAYANHKKLKVPEEEIPTLLQLPPEQATEVIEQARKAGQMGALERDCKNIKAAQLVVGEADVTYSHDTPEQTKQREEQLKQMLQQIRMMDGATVVEGGKDGHDHKAGGENAGAGEHAGTKAGADAKETKEAKDAASKKTSDGNDKNSGFKIV